MFDRAAGIMIWTMGDTLQYRGYEGTAEFMSYYDRGTHEGVETLFFSH